MQLNPHSNAATRKKATQKTEFILSVVCQAAQAQLLRHSPAEHVLTGHHLRHSILQTRETVGGKGLNQRRPCCQSLQHTVQYYSA